MRISIGYRRFAVSSVHTMVKGSTVCQGLGFPPHAGPVFDQPEPGRKIEPFKSLASSPGSIFFETPEADVTAIQIDAPRNKSPASEIIAISK